MILKNSVFFIGIALLTLTSCLKNKAIEPVPEVEETGSFPCGDTVFFNGEILGQILTPSCNLAGCHNSSAAGGYDLTNYSNVNTNANLILNVIQHGDGVTAMPIGGSKLNDSVNKI